MRILVVEDDAKMAELLQRGLSKEGHSVEVAGDGLKGLEKGQSLQFDAIVLDIMLPGLDGLSVARRLRSGGVRSPILMLTARDSAPDIVRGLDVGAATTSPNPSRSKFCQRGCGSLPGVLRGNPAPYFKWPT